MRYSKGIMWLDDCRIPFVDEGENTMRKQTPISVGVYGWVKHKGQIGSFDDSAKQGRFTPNLLCMDDVLNDGSITKQTKWNKTHNDSVGGVFGGGRMNQNNSYGDKGSNSRYYNLDLWFDKMLERL